jgi:hypothetical protein
MLTTDHLAALVPPDSQEAEEIEASFQAGERRGL